MPVNNTQICKLKGLDNILPYNFCLVSVSKDFTKTEMNEMN